MWMLLLGNVKDLRFPPQDYTKHMVFVLDNYDSFTYNLVQYMGELGAEMVIRRNDELTVEQIDDLNPERIVLSPGPCTPQEAGISIPSYSTLCR